MEETLADNKTWRDKLEAHNPSHGKIVKILIPKPLDVDALIRTVPKGKLITDEQIRERLAKDYHADKTCSKVTGIFLRIAAEAAEEDRRRGLKKISPYWRVIKKDGGLNPKFPGGIEAQASRLESEGHEVIRKGKEYLVTGYEKNLIPNPET